MPDLLHKTGVFKAKEPKKISDFILKLNASRNTNADELVTHHYTSPQSYQFKCGSCMFLNRADNYCKALKAYVEVNGICELWKHSE